jgi:hypothetical protein
VIMFVVDFEYRGDGGPRLIGPFGTKEAADRWVVHQRLGDGSWTVRLLYVPDGR